MNLDILLLFGVILLVGLTVGEGSKRIKAPTVVGYIMAGVLIGPTLLNLLPPEKVTKLVPLTSFALAIIGFNIGAELEWKRIKSLGKSIFFIVIFESILAFIFVGAGVYLFTGHLEYGLIFGSLAAATAPAATVDVIYEYKAKGPLTTTLLAVVGLDDAMAIFIYSFSLSFAKTFISPTVKLNLTSVVLHPLKEIFGSLLLGIILGFIFVIIAKKIKNKMKTLILTLAFLLIGAGISMHLHFSLILTSMAMGVCVVNISSATSHKVLDVIGEFVPPIYIIFFALVGARLNLRNIKDIGLMSFIICGLYVVLRATGKYIGVYLGALISKAKETVRKYLGFALFSQAGVAIGLAIFSSNQLSAISEKGKTLAGLIILIVTLTTFIVQLIGPPFVKFAIFKAKENGSQK